MLYETENLQQCVHGKLTGAYLQVGISIVILLLKMLFTAFKKLANER